MAISVGGLNVTGHCVVIKKKQTEFNGKTYPTLELGGLGFAVNVSCTVEQAAGVNENDEVEFISKAKSKPTDKGNIIKLELVKIGKPGEVLKRAA